MRVDSVLHLMLSVAIYCIIFVITHHLINHNIKEARGIVLSVSFIATLIGTIFYEVYQEYYKVGSNFSFNDIVHNILGLLFIYLISYFIYYKP